MERLKPKSTFYPPGGCIFVFVYMYFSSVYGLYISLFNVRLILHEKY